MNQSMTTTAGLWLALTTAAALAAPQAVPLRPGTITGHVRDTRGKPLVGIPVMIMQTGEATATDKKGAYLFTQEDPGAYTLAAEGGWSPAVTTRTQVPVYSQVVQSFTLHPAGFAVFDFVLKPLGRRWVSPQPYPVLVQPQKERQRPPDDAFGGGVFGGDAGLHSTARSSR